MLNNFNRQRTTVLAAANTADCAIFIAMRFCGIYASLNKKPLIKVG